MTCAGRAPSRWRRALIVLVVAVIAVSAVTARLFIWPDQIAYEWGAMIKALVLQRSC